MLLGAERRGEEVGYDLWGVSQEVWMIAGVEYLLSDVAVLIGNRESRSRNAQKESIYIYPGTVRSLLVRFTDCDMQ